jgi:hypothetical protein
MLCECGQIGYMGLTFKLRNADGETTVGVAWVC